jgi:hypothetical protein
MHANELLSKIEASRMWAYFHKDWLLQIRSLIRPQLPRNYFVFVESETVLITPTVESGTGIMPDIGITRPALPPDATRRAGRASAAILEVEEPCELFQQYSLVIRRSPDNQLVAAVEILSPTNKGIFGTLEQDKYLRKRGHYLEAGVNFLEIDALLEGERMLPRSLSHLASYARVAWCAFHHDAVRRLSLWGWNQDDPMPVIPWSVEYNIEIFVDLAAAFEQAVQFNPWDSLV